LLGLQEGIDNAAHIGGLIGGILVGMGMYPSLAYPHKKLLVRVNLLLLLTITGVFITWALFKIPNWGVKYEKAIQQFVENEETAMNYYKLSDFTSKEERLRELNEVGIPKWQANVALMEKILEIDQLPDQLRQRVSKLHKYSQLRLRSFEILRQGMLEEGKDFSAELKEVHAHIRDVLIEINPDEPSRYIERAKEFKEKGNLKAALKDYDVAIALNPSNPYLRMQRARIYYQVGDYISAIVDYNQAIELLPNDVDLLIEAASCKEIAGLYQEALQHYDQAIRLSPNASPAYNGRAWVHHQLGNDQLAIKDLQKAIELNPSYAYAYNNLGLLEEERGNEKESFAYFKKAAEVDEGADYAYRNVARIFVNKKNYSRAFQAYSMAIRADNLDGDNYFGRARIAFLLQSYDSMLADLNEAIQLQPHRAVLYEFRAIAKEKKNAPLDEIRSDLTLAATLDTLNSIPTASHYTYQAGLFLEAQLYAQAERDYRKAISLDSTYAIAFGNLGWLKYLQRQYDSCIIYSQRAIHLDDKSFYAKYNLALAHLCLGRTEEAIKRYFTFKNQELAFRGYISQGAIDDLKDLIKKKEKIAAEARFILEEIFQTKP
ncbi:MAG: tetratricopeptide repeat protein, partial [Flammeovirgaceae bacterium]|nr:tetratricopeptide repeat protein [Flammeovirgaceae bacterium]